MSESEVKILFDAFDIENNGSIQHEDFINSVIGIMNEQRRLLVFTIYSFLKDISENNEVTLDILKSRYSAEKAPEVIRKKKIAEELRNEFIETFEIWHKVLCKNDTQIISRDEFEHYYDSVSMIFDEEKQFENFVSGVWRIDKLAFEKQKKFATKETDSL